MTDDISPIFMENDEKFIPLKIVIETILAIRESGTEFDFVQTCEQQNVGMYARKSVWPFLSDDEIFLQAKLIFSLFDLFDELHFNDDSRQDVFNGKGLIILKKDFNVMKSFFAEKANTTTMWTGGLPAGVERVVLCSDPRC